MANFSLTGQLVTDTIRDLWSEKKYGKALKYGLETLSGSNISHIQSIIDGEYKLIGINDLDLVIDDSGYTPEFSFMDCISLMETNETFKQKAYANDIAKGQYLFSEYSRMLALDYDHDRIIPLFYEWETLIPDAKKDLQDKMPFYFRKWLRTLSPDIDVRNRAEYDSRGIVESIFGDTNKIVEYEQFKKECEKYLIPDIEDQYEKYKELRHRIAQPIITSPNKEVLIEQDKLELKNKYKKDITMSAKFGWLTKNGTYYTCEFAEHETLAKIIVNVFHNELIQTTDNKQYSDILLNLGYVKIHQCDIGFSYISFKTKPNHDQNIKIERYIAVNKIQNYKNAYASN